MRTCNAYMFECVNVSMSANSHEEIVETKQQVYPRQAVKQYDIYGTIATHELIRNSYTRKMSLLRTHGFTQFSTPLIHRYIYTHTRMRFDILIISNRNHYMRIFPLVALVKT